jgi:hypothetical protein
MTRWTSAFSTATLPGPWPRPARGSHRDPFVAEVLTALMNGAGADSPGAELERAVAVKALGPLRLKYMKDDAPVEGFRLVEKTIVTIDAAYNEEALASKSG